MKKGIALLFVTIILALNICSCNNNTKTLENIASELHGAWKIETAAYERTYYFKGDGTYSTILENFLGSSSETGTYEIQDGKILLTKSGEEGTKEPFEIPYNYNDDNGKLTIYFHDLIMSKIN